MRPLVAITTTAVSETGPFRRMQVALYAIYLEVLERYGLAPVLVTPAHTAASLPALLDHCQGLVLTGGEDVDPARYGEAPLPGLGVTNPARDETELLTLGLALERKLPVLGICRGCQLVNVHFGGSLYQDLTLQGPSEVRHRQKEPWERRTHRVQIEPDSKLAAIVATEALVINSFHHQGVKEVGAGLRVVARAEDGTVEAIERPESTSWLLGVQWHPERFEATAPETDSDRRIFQEFSRQVGERLARH
jgi:putative glutamine amidotransferase